VRNYFSRTPPGHEDALRQQFRASSSSFILNSARPLSADMHNLVVMLLRPVKNLNKALNGGVTMTLRPYVTVLMTPSSMRLAELRLSLVGAHHGAEDVLEHSFGTPRGPAGQR
jgi:hypothetical protein